MNETADFIIIGGGIAGVSVAAGLAEHGTVVLVEAEPHLAMHATGRSAAYFAPAYGSPTVRAVTKLSESFYRSPPVGFSDAPLLRERAALFLACDEQLANVEAMRDEMPWLQMLTPEAVRAAVSVINPDYVAAGLLDDSGGDLDVDAIVQGFARRARKRGVLIRSGQRVEKLNRVEGLWRLQVSDGVLAAPVIVNAAGAWADAVAGMAGLASLGLQPKRRTAALVPAPDYENFTDWPLLIDIDEQFYFKPDAGALLISPADETPSEPCDAQVEEMDLALGIDRIEKATTLDIQRVTHRWAGLRTFAPDKEFVVGFDPRTEGFFWLAGQGGYGVQTAPGLARLATAALSGSDLEAQNREVLDFIHPQRLLTD